MIKLLFWKKNIDCNFVKISKIMNRYFFKLDFIFLYIIK